MKGYVFKIGKTWHMTVWDGEKTVVTDNTNDWQTMFDTCYFHVAAFRRVTKIGHRIEKPYSQLVHEARGHV